MSAVTFADAVAVARGMSTDVGAQVVATMPAAELRELVGRLAALLVTYADAADLDSAARREVSGC